MIHLEAKTIVPSPAKLEPSRGLEAQYLDDQHQQVMGHDCALFGAGNKSSVVAKSLQTDSVSDLTR